MVKRFRFSLVMQISGVRIKAADPIKLSQVVNSPTVTVWKEASSMNTMEAIVKYSRAFYLRCKIQSVDVRMKVVVDDTVSSEHLTTKIRGFYSR